MNQKLLSYSFLAVLFFSCNPQHGSKDFAESIGQSERIIMYMQEYKTKKFDSPSGTELRNFIHEIDSEAASRVTKGWTFHDAGSFCIASKQNVQNSQGGYTDIFVHSNQKYTLTKSPKTK